MRIRRNLSRREIIRYGSGALTGVLFSSLSACSKSSFESSVASGTTGSGATEGSDSDSSVSSCVEVPTETNGPYPADGSNSNSDGDKAVDYLTLSGAVRSDITTSITQSTGYTGSTAATGVPLSLTFKLVDVKNGCSDLAGYAIYIWHCDANGNYSMYSSGYTKDTFLRGMQVTDSNGEATFTSVFPGCYDGRIPHIHFEVYKSLSVATKVTNVSKISQLTFPIATMSEVYYNRSDYSKSLTNYKKNKYESLGFSADNILEDAATSSQLASINSGSYSSGYRASLVVGVKSAT